MRKILALGAFALALPFSTGCAVTGGACDCAAAPGDSTGYNPHVTYHATCPGGCAHGAAAAAPSPTSYPISESTGGAGVFEPIAPPKAK